MNKKLLFAATVIASTLGMTSVGALADAAPRAVSGIQILPAANMSSRPAASQRMIYNRALHGNRCSVRRGACVHYYHGYYYERSWWTVGAPAILPGVWIYNSRLHGPRYSAYRAGYGYRYGGYYYSRPWWSTAPGISVHIN